MGIRRGISIQLVAAAFVLAGAALSQDSPSLGDLARQQRQQREQAAAAPDKNSNTPKVITNEEIPEQTDEAPTSATKNGRGGSSMSASKGGKQSAEFWKSRIQAQKGQIASLKRRIDEINGSIRFSSFDCGANCELRNARQRSKQGQVEQMQGQLEQQTKRLEEMQDAARKQGYGSSVYDP